MIPRPDLLDSNSPAGLEVFQLTDEADVPSSHVYMEAQIFAPDSKRFILHRSAHAHGSDMHDPRHRYLLCDLADGGKLTPVTDEVGATAPSVSPDGSYLYYFVNQTQVGGGRLTLKRRRLDGGDPQTISVVDGRLPGTKFSPSRIYPLSTISSDGRKVAVSAYLGDGTEAGAPFGLMVFDVATGEINLILSGPSWCNMHPQYSRSLDGRQSRDILVQENHGNFCDAQGKCVTLVSGRGADIHVIRDDGMSFRDMPWGRDGVEKCQGHQCWRGRTDWAITSTSDARLIEGRAEPHADHDGLLTPGAVRNDLTSGLAEPRFFHFATDIAGARLITDQHAADGPVAVYCARLGEAGHAPLAGLTYLLDSRSQWRSQTHIHPFLSPDGTMGFFNSCESGVLQAYMVRNLPF
ncbi:MAG: TolB family protein [Phycisphaerae bacterium]